VQIIRSLPVTVLLSVLLALGVCAVAWVLAGRPCRARARHGIEFRRLEPDPVGIHGIAQSSSASAGRVVGPDDDPEFIRELARTIAERGLASGWNGEDPPDPLG